MIIDISDPRVRKIAYPKALFISFSDNGTPYDFDNKVFIDAKKALEAYRKFKKISKYKLMIWKVWGIPVNYHHGYTWMDRKIGETQKIGYELI